MSEPRQPDAPTCPWCGTPVPDAGGRCPACGAAVAQREAIGDLAIPGVTAVDPALRSFDAQPLHLKPASPSQGVAAGVIPAVALGGPLGLAALGGIAAVAAAEYRGAAGAGGAGAVDPRSVGDPSEAARLAVERLERGEPIGAEGADRAEEHGGTGRPAPGGETLGSGAGSGERGVAEPPADPWRDLPNG